MYGQTSTHWLVVRPQRISCCARISCGARVLTPDAAAASARSARCRNSLIGRPAHIGWRCRLDGPSPLCCSVFSESYVCAHDLAHGVRRVQRAMRTLSPHPCSLQRSSLRKLQYRTVLRAVSDQPAFPNPHLAKSFSCTLPTSPHPFTRSPPPHFLLSRYLKWSKSCRAARKIGDEKHLCTWCARVGMDVRIRECRA
jgi:hypothetical protein